MLKNSKALEVSSEAETVSERFSATDSAARELSDLINTTWYDDVGSAAMIALNKIASNFGAIVKDACGCTVSDMSAIRSADSRLSALIAELDKLRTELTSRTERSL